MLPPPLSGVLLRRAQAAALQLAALSVGPAPSTRWSRLQLLWGVAVMTVQRPTCIQPERAQRYRTIRTARAPVSSLDLAEPPLSPCVSVPRSPSWLHCSSPGGRRAERHSDGCRSSWLSAAALQEDRCQSGLDQGHGQVRQVRQVRLTGTTAVWSLQYPPSFL